LAIACDSCVSPVYEQFTEAFYEWKKEPYFTTLIERKKLNEALGLLAREAIDKEKSRFGIQRDFALKVMREDLFKLATEKLHWLVHTYNDAEIGKPVYAFFHPTFQEYFAACAIDDWHFFLNHICQNPQDTKASYRIFAPYWKEVITLWLGREVDQEFRKQKEAFIDALVEFQDRRRFL
jgi:predicted NACHT family NTPase